jgi:hypothetical protein
VVQRNGASSVSLAKFREILAEASQRGLVDIGDYDAEVQDVEVAIRPMIKLISGADSLLRLERYVRSQEVGLSEASGDDT